MICVIGSFPSHHNLKDGMIQRVAHIDSLISTVKRTYIEISFRDFLHKQHRIEGLATIYSLNFFVHYFRIRRLVRKAKVVYVHSAYNALKFLLFKTKAKVIFDVHGVVPEERKQMGDRALSIIFSLAERLIIKHCDILICVSNTMLSHYHKKYGKNMHCIDLVLPVLPKFAEPSPVSRFRFEKRLPNSVVYAGGMQLWQNVDKMINAAEMVPNFQFTFLTGDIERFREKLRQSKIINYTCQSVQPERVKDYYLTHSYGFILRDDNLVNRVACPTKLVEYMFWGVIPIVITPKIGDFSKDCLKCLTLAQFINGDLPNNELLTDMRLSNFATIVAVIKSASLNETRLRAAIIEST